MIPHRPFRPYPGFDPLDGDDTRVTLSLDNPTRPQSLPDHRKLSYPNGGEKAGDIVTHEGADK